MFPGLTFVKQLNDLMRGEGVTEGEGEGEGGELTSL